MTSRHWAPESSLVGTCLEGRYRIDAPIARGGMSAVYMGVDLRLDRPIAVKVMDPKYAVDPEFVSRFEFEGRAVARLKDPGLVAVYDQVVDGELAFLVMELVAGGTLRELLRERGPMPPHAAAAVIGPVLDALGAAHDAGLVHRDVKPENILISVDGEVKVADFGLVRAVSAAGVTSSSVILGTAAYLAPEQVEDGIIDSRTDVYASGIVLYELLTGKTPFTGENAISLAYQRLSRDVPPPSLARDGIPRQFDDLVACATSRNPDKRFADGTSMADALAAMCVELSLPPFTVPAPSHSAEQRTEIALKQSALPPRSLPQSPHPTRVDSVPLKGTYPDDHDPARDDGDSTRHAGRNSELDAEPDLPPAAPRPYDPTTLMGRHIEKFPRRHRAAQRRTALITALVLLITVAIAVAGWWIGSGRFTHVPDLTGLDRSAATNRLHDDGFTVNDNGIYDNSAPRGSLVSINPPSGQRVPRWSIVTVNYSLGRPKVPAVDPQLSQTQVEQHLRELTFRPVVGGDEYSPNVRQGGVAAFFPASGTTLPVGSQVTMSISKGARPVPVPDVRGKSEAQARQLLTQSGFKVGAVTSTFDSKLGAGKAIGTSPTGHDMAPEGSVVALLVSNSLTVPDVTGLSPNEATSRLQSAGMQALNVGTTTDGHSPIGSVGKTNPPPGGFVDPAQPNVQIFVTDGVTVPDVTGKKVLEARKTLQAAGFKVKLDGLLRLDGSLVIRQSIAPNTQVSPGSEITLTTLP